MNKNNVLTALTGVFVASLVMANLIGSKLIDVFTVTISVGIFVFPFTFLTADIITELFGKEVAGQTVKTGILVQIYVLFFVFVGGLFAPSRHHDIGNAYEVMFGLTPRMVVASIIAFSVSQLLDVKIFSVLKARLQGRYLLLRTNVTSWVSQFVDTLIFMAIFLGGVIPFYDWCWSFVTAYLCKMAVASLDSPVVNLVVAWVRSNVVVDGGRNASVSAVKTRVLRRGDRLEDFLATELAAVNLEGAVLAVTSKIVSVAEGRVVSGKADKAALVKQEADYCLCEGGYGVQLTIKHGLLIPSAGIDESNSQEGNYILYPEDPYASAQKIWIFLKKHFHLKNVGVLLTDSHILPLRNGVTGIALAHWGFKATLPQAGRPDLFGRPLKFTHIDVIDAVAGMAVYAMGEANNQTPLAIVREAGVEFTEHSSADEIGISPELDLYYPLLRPYMSRQ